MNDVYWNLWLSNILCWVIYGCLEYYYGLNKWSKEIYCSEKYVEYVYIKYWMYTHKILYDLLLIYIKFFKKFK